jgi:hypothetical protein
MRQFQAKKDDAAKEAQRRKRIFDEVYTRRYVDYLRGGNARSDAKRLAEEEALIAIGVKPEEAQNG